MNEKVELARIELPDFGTAADEPQLGASLHRARIERLRQRAKQANYDLIVVYADREHFANMAYLTGFGPRFEEALLILNLRENGKKPLLLVGNECHTYCKVSPIYQDLEVELFQSLSLLGQDRSHSRPLKEILRDAGVKEGRRVGVAGWKHFSAQETTAPQTCLEIPSYIADTLRALTGSVQHVENANALFMDSSHGLRAVNEVQQLAWFEYMACQASDGVRRVLFGLRPGMSELEIGELMRLNGLPLSCHPNIASGERASLGMPSPSTRRIGRGEPFMVGLGLWGALNCRAGFLVENEAELPVGINDYVKKLVAPYFGAVASWYETIGIGVEGGALYDVIHKQIGDPFFGLGLNPGHLIHLDEWVNSPIYEGSTEVMQSGMVIQVDVIPATGTEYFMSNIEDGIALADEALRAEFAAQYPQAWARIQARRAFMRDSLGITLKPEVLPFSNIPGFLPPYLLAPELAMRKTAG